MGREPTRTTTAPVAPGTNRNAVCVKPITLTVKAYKEFHAPGQYPWRDGESARIEEAKVELGARVELGGELDVVASARLKKSTASLDLCGVSDGEYTLRLSPVDGQLSQGPAGPYTNYSKSQKFAFRPVDVSVSIEGGRLKTKPELLLTSRPMHAKLVSDTATEIRLDWKPDWFATSAISSPRPRGTKITHVIIHHTSAATMSHVHKWTFASHYVVNRDGHVVKVVEEDFAAQHAGPSFWRGKENLNECSVGIEQVGLDGLFSPDYTEEQYAAMIRLVGEIMKKYGDIEKSNVVGHSSVVLWDYPKDKDKKVIPWRGEHTLVSRDCPGQKYDWKRLEDANLAIGPLNIPIDHGAFWGGYFAKHPSQSLRMGDSDEKHQYGGRLRGSGEFGKLIEAVQTDLRTIGFSINHKDGKTPTGVYDKATRAAVCQFQIRFLSGSRRNGRDDDRNSSLDLLTATTIQQVLANLRSSQGVR